MWQTRRGVSRSWDPQVLEPLPAYTMLWDFDICRHAVQNKPSLFEDIAAWIPWERGDMGYWGGDYVILATHKNWNFLPYFTHTVWVFYILSWSNASIDFELELWASVDLVLFLFWGGVDKQSNVVSWVIVIPHWFEGSVSVLCYQSVWT